MNRKISVYAVTMTSNATSSTHIDMGDYCYNNIYLRTPSTTTGCDIKIQGSHDGTTFYQVYYPPVSGTVAVSAVQIGSAVTAKWVNLNGLFGFRYIKFEATSAVSDTSMLFRVCTN